MWQRTRKEELRPPALVWRGGNAWGGEEGGAHIPCAGVIAVVIVAGEVGSGEGGRWRKEGEWWREFVVVVAGEDGVMVVCLVEKGCGRDVDHPIV